MNSSRKLDMTESQEKQYKILFVDGDEMMRILFRDIFWVHGRGEHYEVCLAATLREAEGIIQNPETRPDIAVFGLQTPAEKGLLGTSSQMKDTFEYIKKLKADSNLSGM